MKKVLITLLTVLLSTAAYSQSYDKAIGLRLGYWPAIDYKVNLSSENFLDFSGMIGMENDGTSFMAAGFYNWQWEIKNAEGLTWYLGPGASVGSYYYDKDKDHDKGSAFFLSVNFMIGLEYKFSNIPLAISLDYAPGFRITRPDPSYYCGGLCVKYCF